MGVRIGKLFFHDWLSLQIGSGWTDTFIFHLTPMDGLPPADYAALIRPLCGPLRKVRPDASLWVQIWGQTPEQTRNLWADPPAEDSGLSLERASWFRNELQYAVRRARVAIAVTNGLQRPGIWDFTYFPWMRPWPYTLPPEAEMPFSKYDLQPAELRCLRALARADCAFTAELASLAGMSRKTALAALRGLKEIQLVDRNTVANYPNWKIRRPGVSAALRSWGHSPGLPFRYRKERGPDACLERLPEPVADENSTEDRERVTFFKRGQEVRLAQAKRGSQAYKQRRRATRRHRRTSRLWPGWLRKALPQAEIWAGWSEVTCGRSRPDGLCWGAIYGREALFWLEVESGHDSRAKLQRKMIYRINKALLYARQSPVLLVFTLMAPRWVLAAMVDAASNLPDDLALVLADWKAFGWLPRPDFGKLSFDDATVLNRRY